MEKKVNFGKKHLKEKLEIIKGKGVHVTSKDKHRRGGYKGFAPRDAILPSIRMRMHVIVGFLISIQKLNCKLPMS